MGSNWLRVWSAALLALLLVIVVPAAASAQGFISPFIGYDFGGDSGCLELTDCEDKNGNYGVSFGAMGRVVGFEAEIGYAKDFFGESPDTSSSVLTFMANLMIGPKIGPVRPYVVGGLGMVKTHAELTVTDLLEDDNTDFGWDFGGGLMVMFGENVGVRGDIRRFSTFDLPEILGLDLGEGSLSFNRVAAALVLAF